MNLRWVINRTNPEFLQYLSRSATISPLLAQILVNRGIKTVAGVNDFLNPGISGLSDPYELPGMRQAVDRIRAALLANERVLVHGDYDADGLTATSILLYTLKKIGLETEFFVPNRVAHGYGFNRHGVDIAKKRDISLIITVDCGITSFDTADYALEAGIDVIITDHHEPRRGAQAGPGDRAPGQALVPQASAVINPKLAAACGPASDLSGAGVAFKISQALSLERDIPFSPEESFALLDLAALGTIADVVPLTGENRIIVKEGLRYVREANRPGVRAMKEVCGTDSREVKAGLLSFTMIPRINAAGRMADAGDVVRLFLSEAYEEAMDISCWLDRLNSERQKTEEYVYLEALNRIGLEGIDSVIVVSAEGWHQGVLGIVASRLAEKFSVPAFVLSVEDGIAKGSARSVPCFDVCAGLSGCSSDLLTFGGHKQAAGLKLKADDLPAFTRAIRAFVKQSLGDDGLAPALQIDASIELPEVTSGLVREISMLEPFGCCNEEPLFGARELDVITPRVVGNNHLKMKLGKGAYSVDSIGFNMARLYEQFDRPSMVDAVFTPGINEWNGGKYLQMVLKAIRPAGQG